ncbi:MAG: Putative periplasmic protein [Candidatus Tokpelaia hoelldobleri]|uniref:Periplasmic protein n=1 Tax=Candidatus Tokpelaia hoelldobleri TaxID=1902579 RepID=A0A1U9JSG9_9HYPH|nr:MAG: Putative periplasmic protein [Candidatus Tokpelaia hoelldoblerii]
MSVKILKKMHKIIYVMSALFLHSFAVSAAPMVFSVEVNGGTCIYCTWYQAEGEITKETPAVLQAFFDQHRIKGLGNIVAQLSMQLNSSGGDFFAAMEVGRILRKEGISTRVGSTVRYNENGVHWSDWGEDAQCGGACIFAYLGGHSWEGGEFAIKSYRPPFADMEKRDITPQRREELSEIAYILAYAREMGFDPSFIYLGKQDGSLYTINVKEAEKLSLIFDADEVRDWAIEQRDGGLVAVARSSNREKGAEFYCDASGMPYFLLYYKKQFPEDSRGWVLGSYDMIASIFNVNVAVTDDHVTETDKYSTFRAALPGVNFSNDDGYSFYMSAQTKLDPVWQMLRFADTTSMKLYGPVIMQNCLEK